MLIIERVDSMIGETIGMGYHIERIVTKPTSYEFIISKERKIWLPHMNAPRMTREERTITLSRIREVLGGWVFVLDKEHILTIHTDTLKDKKGFIATLGEAIRLMN